MARKKTKRPSRRPNANVMTRKEAEQAGYARGLEAAKYFEPDGDTRISALDDTDNLAAQALEAEEHSRSFSPFEHFAAEINRHDEDTSDILWSHYEAGVERGVREGVKERFGSKSKNPKRGKRKATKKNPRADLGRFDSQMRAAEQSLLRANELLADHPRDKLANAASINELLRATYFLGAAREIAWVTSMSKDQDARLYELEAKMQSWGDDFIKATR